MNSPSQYEQDLGRNAANYVPLSPVSFLFRTARLYPDRTAVIYGDHRQSWRDFERRCRRLASAFNRIGVGLGDTVAVIAPNVPAVLEAHFGVPMAGAVLNTLNVRLDAMSIAFQLEHGAAKVVLVDPEFAPVVAQALHHLSSSPIVIELEDPAVPASDPIGTTTYEEFIATGDPAFEGSGPSDEWQAIALNYTSGTTGNPKGVVYHHRGAYLNAIGNVFAWNMQLHPVYLWALPMFHCNGWCFPWTIAAQAGTHVCLRKVTADAIFDALVRHGVTHLCGAPVVMNMLLNASVHQKNRELPATVQMMTAGSAPPAAVIEGIENMGFSITHVYGLTEVYGPATVCAWRTDWDALPADERGRLKARQGVTYLTEEALMVADPRSMCLVPKNGETIGEVFLRGNVVMKGYLKNPAATREAFQGGWFHTGDLGVWHPDGYIEIKDRSKDIIISGGENISTIEVEDVLYRHPHVLEAAVVQRPDKIWGESPCAFVMLKEGASVTADDLIDFCRARLAKFKVPRTIVFGPLPKTSTGKVQKFLLRERAQQLDEETGGAI